MVLNAREELLHIIENLPESEVEKVLNILKQKNTSEKFISDNLLDEVETIFKEDNGLLKRLAQ